MRGEVLIAVTVSNDEVDQVTETLQMAGATQIVFIPNHG